MPIINQQIQLPPGHRIGIWRIDETSQQLLQMASALGTDSLAAAQALKSERRRREWLAVRLLAQSMTGAGAAIAYRESGQPYIPGLGLNISISHADGLAAVLVSDYYSPAAGIDVERITPRIERIKDKFLLPGEIAAMPEGQELRSLYLHWCAKEAMYKAYNIAGYDYQNSYRLCGISPSGTHSGRLQSNGETFVRFSIVSHQIMDYMLCVAIAQA